MFVRIVHITNLSGQALYNVPKSKFVQLFVGILPKNEQINIICKIEQYFRYISQIELYD